MYPTVGSLASPHGNPFVGNPFVGELVGTLNSLNLNNISQSLTNSGGTKCSNS